MNKPKLTLEMAKERVEHLVCDMIIDWSTYRNTCSRVSITCKKCGHKFSRYYFHMANMHIICPKCRKKRTCGQFKNLHHSGKLIIYVSHLGDGYDYNPKIISATLLDAFDACIKDIFLQHSEDISDAQKRRITRLRSKVIKHDSNYKNKTLVRYINKLLENWNIEAVEKRFITREEIMLHPEKSYVDSLLKLENEEEN